MDLPKSQFGQTHDAILDAGQLLFQEKGYRGTSLRDIMAHAGLTIGAFYSHFDSKSDLFATCFQRASEAGTQILFAGSAENGYRKVVEKYLSPVHIGNKEKGCPLAALLSELDQFQKENAVPIVDKYVDKFSTALLTQGVPKDSTLALMSLMLGALALARCVKSKELKMRIVTQSLQATDLIVQGLDGQEPEGQIR